MRGFRKHRLWRPACVWGVVVAALAVGSGGGLRACSTPVYRYAMINWPPAPYVVCYFQNGKPSPGDLEVEHLLKQAANGREPADPTTAEPQPVANVEYTSVDVSKPDEIQHLAPPLKKAWKAHEKEKGPLHVVLAPWGQEVFVGRLDAATVRSLLDSPIRQKLGKLMHDGHAAVMLLLAGKKAQRNPPIEQALDEMIAAAGTGKLPSAGDDGLPAKADAEPKKADAAADKDGPAEGTPGGLKIARLTIHRDDPAEKWLCDLLQHTDEDIDADEPAVFPVFGRGRLLPPLRGEALSGDGLAGCAAFLGGECSCQLKDQLRGADLLMTWDWDTTAEHLAEADPDASDRSPAYREVAMGAAPPGTAEKPLSAAKPAANDSVKPAAKPNPQPAPEAKSAAPAKAPAKPAGPSGRVIPTQDFEIQTAANPLPTYGIGIAAAVVVLAVASWVAVRRM